MERWMKQDKHLGVSPKGLFPVMTCVQDGWTTHTWENHQVLQELWTSM